MIPQNIIMSTGKKIKLIRKSLNLTQTELVCGKFSRNLLSYIENEKVKLMPDIAQLIAENVNKIAEEKGINIYISTEYLLESELEQARRILIKIMDKLKEYGQVDKMTFHNELKRVESILSNWNVLDIGSNIYSLAGKYYYNKGEYSQGYLYYMKALENYTRQCKPYEVVETILNLGRCFLKLHYYNESINLNNYALSLSKNNKIVDIDINNKIFFNNALAYKKQKCFDECLDEINKLEQSKLNLYQKLDVTLLKANCHLGKQEYDIALHLYEEILNLVKESNATKYLDLIAKVYNNIGDIYLAEGDTYAAKKYKLKAFNIAKKGTNKTVLLVLISLADVCIKTGENSLVEKYLLKYKNQTENNDNLMLRLEVYTKLIEIYFNRNDIESINKVFKEIKLMLLEYNDKGILKKIEKLYFLASYYYIDIDKNKSKEYLKIGLDIQNIYN